MCISSFNHHQSERTMAFACLPPVATFPSHLKAHPTLNRLPCPLSSFRHVPSPWSLHETGNLLAGKYGKELDEPGTVKWRTRVSFMSSSPKNKSREDVKQELLKAIEGLDCGAEATSEEQERVDQIARELEAVNPITEPLKSDLLNGKWELLYTTSRSILQPQRPKILRPFGKIYQAINADTLRAQNIETWPFFNQVTANLVPLNARRVAVKFDRFKIGGLIPIVAPGRARGELEITYLDEEISLQAALATVDKGKNLNLEDAVERIAEEASAPPHDRQDAVDSISEGINNLSVSLSKETSETSKTGDCSGADIDKRIRALKKKIRLAEGQLKGDQLNMKPEQTEKMAKIEGWHAELKLLQDKRTSQAS